MAEESGLTARLAARIPATLQLQDGSVFHGFSFGHPESIAGEVVFNTGMVGYPESLSDPSYAGQILVLTYPLVGNYGVPEEGEVDEHGLARFFESDKIHVKALIISDYSFQASHHSAKRTLAEWMKSQKFQGSMVLTPEHLPKDFEHAEPSSDIRGSVPFHELPWDDPNARNLVDEVSRKKKMTFTPSTETEEIVSAADGAIPPRSPHYCAGKVHILAVDCGIKNNIIRYLVNVLGVKLT
eukprot:CAMPEP_0178466088 /NCGR_PEP_ID=MMETSP0689_2-20121128/51715_1 /TAXON_ID=160604 /ORGANISM="Amphidinium massartii, Strain CS-259" /LENGTH=239 /DNA_ID=CAMNT_0020093085 /DNA_START=22 /DNA_END=738 /DNA_ORIENTATION=-